MCPHDPADSSSVTNGDDPTPVQPRLLAADATRPGDSDSAGATLTASNVIWEDVIILGFRDTGTIDYIPDGPSQPSARPLLPAGPSPDAATGTVPGFDVLESLGEGGMGVVYKARQVGLNRLVALKVILGGRRAGPKDLIRFLAEAEAVASVKHPHVVQVHEYGEVGGRPFLALEYLPGGSLAERLKAGPRGPSPAEAAAEVRRQACPGRPGGARPGDRPPRPQVGQRPLRRPGRTQGHRLRPGQAGRSGPDLTQGPGP